MPHKRKSIKKIMNGNKNIKKSGDREIRGLHLRMHLQLRDSPGITFPSYFRYFIRKSEMQAMGSANSDTGRLQACFQPVNAIIAFDDLANFGIPLGRTPGTGGDAALTPHAKVGIYKHDTILGALLHGPCRAGAYTPGIFAMKARHEHIGRSGLSMNHLGSHSDYIRRFRPNQYIFICFTCDGTTVTANTFLLVLVQIVNAHYYPPSIKEVSLRLV
jgi:hypothetical protein